MKLPRSLSVSQLDAENSLKDNITLKQAQYKRVEAEKRIVNVLLLDEYIKFVESKAYRIEPRNSLTNFNLHVITDMLLVYPFDGGKFSIDLNLLLALLNPIRLATFAVHKNISQDDISFQGLFNVNARQLNKITTLRTALLFN